MLGRTADVGLYWSMQGETQKVVALERLHTWDVAIFQVGLTLKNMLKKTFRSANFTLFLTLAIVLSILWFRQNYDINV